MIVADLSPETLQKKLAQGLRLRTGPLVFDITCDAIPIAGALHLVYGAHPIEEATGFADFHVRLERGRGARRWLRPQARFLFEEHAPFTPVPVQHALPLLEWGLNWCVSASYNRCLILHAAAVERNGLALILPAPSGAGKSTLTAGLIQRGWRLLSDELTIIDPSTQSILPLARPVSLKNASIDVIRRFAPDAVLSPTVHNTGKGSIAHLAPPRDSVARAQVPAKCGWIVLPRYESDAEASLMPLAKGITMMQLADSAFNYTMHGRAGFDLLTDMVSRCPCFEFVYSDLQEAAMMLNELSEQIHDYAPA